jgi:MFS family permease
MTSPPPRGRVLSPATALMLLVGLNLLNYADRSVLSAVLGPLGDAVLSPTDPDRKFKLGALSSAFLIAYMLLAPAFGLLADRWKRWWIVGLGVIGGGLASLGTGLGGWITMGVLAPFWFIFIMRALVGVSEAAYGPAAPTIISDLFPQSRRGIALSWFYLAIPVGSALGYVYGGLMLRVASWQWAFAGLLPPALLLGAVCFFLAEPRRGQSEGGGEGGAPAAAPVTRKLSRADYLTLLRTRSFVWNCAGQTAMTFAIGGIAIFMPLFMTAKRATPGLKPEALTRLAADTNLVFGAIIVVSGLIATLAGGWLADRLRPRFPGAYLTTSGVAMLIGFPLLLGVLFAPAPWDWVCLALCVFFVFLNTGPSNTALANVTHPAIRSSAFALNIFVIHALGDVISPPIIGALADWRRGLGDSDVAAFQWGFCVVAVAMLVAGVCWLIGARWLAQDTQAAPTSLRV